MGRREERTQVNWVKFSGIELQKQRRRLCLIFFNTRFQRTCKNQNILEIETENSFLVQFVPLTRCASAVNSLARLIFHFVTIFAPKTETSWKWKIYETTKVFLFCLLPCYMFLPKANVKNEWTSVSELQHFSFLFQLLVFRSAEKCKNRIINFAINFQFPCSRQAYSLALFTILCVNFSFHFIFNKFSVYMRFMAFRISHLLQWSWNRAV